MRSAPTAVRGSWMWKLKTECQRFICDASGVDSAREQAVNRFVNTIPEASNRLEDLVLRAALARLAIVFSRAVGGRSTAEAPGTAQAVGDILLDTTARPQWHFFRWARRVAVGNAPPPPTPSQVLSLVLHRYPDGTLDLKKLAADVGCSERVARAAFEHAFGISPRTWRRHEKVLRAIELLRTTPWDNESVARELGLRSPKNLYRAVRIDTGLTPRQVRRLSDMELREILGRLQTPAVTDRRRPNTNAYSVSRKRRSRRRCGGESAA